MRRTMSILLPPLLIGLLSFGYRLPKKHVQAEMVSPVNIYVYDSLLLVSDAAGGIHIYSIADRANPVWHLTIPVRGNTGLAVREGIIFANANNDLLAIKVRQDTLYEILSVVNQSPYGYDDHTYYYDDGYDYYGGVNCACRPMRAVDGDATSMSEGSQGPTTGVGGSYATFAVIDSFLYYIDGHYIQTVDISDPEHPRKIASTYVGRQIETLFPTRTHLFVGGALGMYVLDRSDPSSPKQMAQVEHFRSCDPVVVRDTLAFVTLRGGGACGQANDTLLVISVADPYHPKVIGGADATTPYGLAVGDSLLYVANGSTGFTLYDVSDPRNVTARRTWRTVAARDFIWLNPTLYTMTDSDVSIFDVADPVNPSLLATIQ